MSQPAGPLFTPGNRKAAVRFLTNLTPDQQRNFEKMLNHQPRMKRMWNATMNTAQAAWNSQPGLQTRALGQDVASVTRAVGGALGAAGRGAQFAAQNPRQAWDNTMDAGGQALSATGHGIETGLRATGRGIGHTAVAAGRGIANSPVGQSVANTTKGVASGIANSKLGRWVSDKWSRSTVAAEAAFRTFKDGRANPAAPQVSAPDGADLSARATAVVASQSPAEQLAAAEQLVSKLRSEIEQSNTTGMQAAQAPAAQATQSTGAQVPGAAAQQGTEQGAQQGERAQQPDLKKSNGGVQR